MLLIIKEISFKYYLQIMLLLFLFGEVSFAANTDDNFEIWLKSYKNYALKKGITQKTLDETFKDVKFLEQVIKYDRKQPEFFEDTNTYVSKRATKQRAKKAADLYKKNINLFNEVENKFNVEKRILLALWGIETNYGKHVGKMDIISSLATLSFDKRRRDFFSEQLLTL